MHLHLKLTYFLYHNLILFSEKNFQNHSVALLQTVEIFCNLILRNHWT